MNLLAPAALILAVVGAPIVAMYILKMRRPARVLPSTFLWEQALRDVQANAPWQRLRPNLLLLLQLLAVAALVLALARPYTLRAALAQGDVVVVLDASYLMQATDEAPNRFAAARARIGTLIDGLGPNSVMSIVLMARRPRVLIAQSADHAALHAALDRAAPTFETADPVAALDVARALSHGSQQASIFVYTAAGDSPIPSLPGALQPRVVTLGHPHTLRDLGIVAFAATRAADGMVTTLANVANLGSRSASSDVQLDVLVSHGSSSTWDTQADLHPISLAPGASTVVVSARLPANVVAVRAHLTAGDNLVADDTAWAVVPSATQRRVVLVTSGDTFLHLALGLVPGVHLDTLTPATYTAKSARCADAVVFDTWLPRHLPSAAVWAVAPPSNPHSPLGLSVGPGGPAGSLQPGDDPANLLTAVDVRQVGVDRVTPLGVPAWGYAVVRAGGQPVLVVGQNGAQREAVLGFGLTDTDWGLRPSFPILVENLLNYLAPPASGPTGIVRPGDAVALATTSCATGLRVTDPSHVQTQVAPPFPVPSFVGTDTPGLYTVTQETPLGARRTLFAVNLFPLPQASGTRGKVGGNGSGGGTPTGHVVKDEVPVEWAPLVAALALLILGGEWWVAARRR